VKYGLTVLTPTRDRQEAFALCVKWMSRQTHTEPVQWLIIDDGDVEIDWKKDWQVGGNVIVERLRRSPSSDACTLQANILHAIPHIKGYAVVFFEDDEHYSPKYLEMMAAMLDEAELVGEKDAHYYNVASRRWHLAGNTKHASLCRTGIRSVLLPKLEEACIASKADNDVFVDLRLWGLRGNGAASTSILLKDWSGLSVGIKGMPGRGGLGKSHGLDTFKNKDRNMKVLRQWIGEDAKHYEKYYLGRT